MIDCKIFCKSGPWSTTVVCVESGILDGAVTVGLCGDSYMYTVAIIAANDAQRCSNPVGTQSTPHHSAASRRHVVLTG